MTATAVPRRRRARRSPNASAGAGSRAWLGGRDRHRRPARASGRSSGQTGVREGHASRRRPTIVSQMIDDGWSFYWANIKVDAARGGVGLRLGQRRSPSGSRSSCSSCRSSSSRLMQLGIASYCLPVIAIGPILQIIFNGEHAQDHPRRAVRVLHHARRHAGGAAQRRAGDVRRRPRLRRRARRRAREGAHPCRAPEPVRGAAHRGAGRDPRRDHRRVPRWRLRARHRDDRVADGATR